MTGVDLTMSTRASSDPEFRPETDLEPRAYGSAMLPLAAQVPAPPPLPEIPVDPNLIASQVVPLIGAAIALLIGVIAFKVLVESPIGQAIGERIRSRAGRRSRSSVDGGGDVERVVGLEQNVAQLQREVAELAERLDFAERMLAERRQPQLRAGEPSGHHG